VSRTRFLVLTLGPVVIVGASAAGAWLTGNRGAPPPRNDAWSLSQPTLDRDRSVSDASLVESCRRRADQLQRRLGEWPGDGRWSIWSAQPFVVAGLMPPDELQRWCDRTILPAASALWAGYFDVRPHSPVTVLLLPEEAGYRECASWLFGDEDVSVFGYYRPAERTLIANVGTGGGTLVHELTHALMAFDFPDMPDWFSEGLASLHEQCRFRPDGSGIDGLVNWRLPALQQAVRDGTLRPLAELFSDDDFRGELEGLNYAHARYFCLYLQHRGVLEEFYRTFRDDAPDDPTGIQALRHIFPKTSLAALDTAFRRWVLTLRWPHADPGDG
jgi:hypothetical protein